MLTLENIQLGKIINKKLGDVKKGFKFVFNKQKTNIMKNFNEYTKEQIIKSVQNNMTDSEGTQDYLESLTKDELRTLLIQFIVNK